MKRRLAAALALLLPAACALAQEPAPEKRAETVRLNVRFSDDKGRLAPEVRREDVRVLVGGVEQPVTYFEREEAPVSYGLVVDNTGSLRFLINYVIEAAARIVEGNTAGDETFVVRFVSSDQINLLSRFTSDKAALRGALERMVVQGGQTALLDALYFSAEHLEKNAAADAGGKPRRRALILITDGEDRDSYRKPEEVLKLLKRARIQVFCVGLVGELDKERGFIMESKREKAAALLKQLAGETGGRLFLVEKARGELLPAVEAVVGDLHTNYVVGYTPAPPAPGDKPRRKVEVKVIERKGAPKLKAVAVPAAPDPAGEESEKKSGR